MTLPENIPIEEIRRSDTYTLSPAPQWHKSWLSRNKGITMGDIREMRNAEGHWDWIELSRKIPMKDIRRNMVGISPYPWNREGLSRNPGLPMLDTYRSRLPSYICNRYIGLHSGRM